MILCDTGIMSRYFTRQQDIVEKITLFGGEDFLSISIITRIELHNWLSNYYNLDKTNRAKLLRKIKEIHVLHINEPISKIAIKHSDKYVTDHPADIFIGATAIHNEIPLYTLNTKHFLRMKGLKLI